ncbi:hypothetical protein FB451DRAFT_1194131 [Mycena latifolia]|nr:hypothetical protein FB451DRAFT_1194131 [Mycena latifolia]
MSRTNQPDPPTETHTSRPRNASSRLLDGANGEAPSAAHQAILDQTQARLVADGRVSFNNSSDAAASNGPQKRKILVVNGVPQEQTKKKRVKKAKTGTAPAPSIEVLEVPDESDDEEVPKHGKRGPKSTRCIRTSPSLITPLQLRGFEPRAANTTGIGSCGAAPKPLVSAASSGGRWEGVGNLHNAYGMGWDRMEDDGLSETGTWLWTEAELGNVYEAISAQLLRAQQRRFALDHSVFRPGLNEDPGLSGQMPDPNPDKFWKKVVFSLFQIPTFFAGIDLRPGADPDKKVAAAREFFENWPRRAKILGRGLFQSRQIRPRISDKNPDKLTCSGNRHLLG